MEQTLVAKEMDILVNEREIVSKAVNDDQAFEVLYNFYFPKVYGYVLKRVGHQQTAEDLVSVIFIKIFTNLNKYQAGKNFYSFASWVFTVSANAIIDHYRKNNKKVVSIEEVAEIKDENSTIDLIYSHENREKVQNTLKKLKKRYQQIIELKYFLELDNQEIAEALGISVGNVGVLLHRALNKFQNLYEN